MKKHLHLVFVFVLLFSFSVTAQSQTSNPSGVGKGKKAYSVPISDKQITLRVTTPSGQDFNVLVQEGGMAKVLAFSSGYAYALVPIAKGIDNKSSDVAIFRVTMDAEGNESIQILEHLLAESGQSKSTQSDPKLQIQLLRIDNPRAISALQKPLAGKEEPQFANKN